MRKHLLALLGLMAGLCLLLAIGAATVSASTFTVNTTDDTDDSTCDGTHCSLREAINAANSNSGSDTIAFNIPTSDSGYQVSVTGTWTISLTSVLPHLSDDGTTVDGATQAAYAGDTNPEGPEIEITGASLSSGNCFRVIGDNIRILSLVINRFPWHGVHIFSAGSSNEVSGNYIGTDATGKVDQGNGWDGVHIAGAAQDNVIGGDARKERNVISGNDSQGVEIRDSGTTGNTVSGNYIGTDRLGSGDVGNTSYGVYVTNGAQNSIIGGDALGERNVISGNGSCGVYIDGSGTTGNTISANHIGTDASGASDLGNDYNGVCLWSGTQDNVVGGDSPEERNVISGNFGAGVSIDGSGTMSNTVSGNYIGTDISGSSAVTNVYGVYMGGGAQNNVVGGDTQKERNIISGNSLNGVEIRGSGTTGNTVSGNYIGTDTAGSSDLGNHYGVKITDGAHHNVIGGDTAGERNVISANDQDGVWIHGSGANGNTISGNYIGTDAAGTGGTKGMGNDQYGVRIMDGPQGNVIGGDSAGERNVISGSGDMGVRISGGGTMSNTVSGNYIGTNAAGSSDLGNWRGLAILDGAQNNVIGGDAPEERNVISGSDYYGVRISGPGTTGNTVSGNYIGTDASGTSGVGNDSYGVQVQGSAQNNVIGGDTVGEVNVIAFNTPAGVTVEGATTTGNTITENSIHSNSGPGIYLLGGGNTELTAPTIGMADCFSLYVGTAPSNATVEVFTSPDEEGKTYLTTVSADGGGNWTFVGSYTLDTYVTATATDAAGNTSEFSAAVSAETCMQFFAPLAMKQY